jgi:putative hemolysin
MSEAELRMLLTRSTEHGEIEQEERGMIEKVFDFADKDAADVMIPRPEVVALSISLPPDEALRAVIDSPYTRYPVYRETLDDVVGILHIRDLFSAMLERGIADVELEPLLRAAHIVPETKDLASLLQEFRRTNTHFAVVVDEYGGTAGILTLENLLEEIVGDIEDEFDVAEEEIEQIDEDTYRVPGMFPIDEFNERFGTDLPDEDFHTVGGFVFGQLGRAPESGDDVSWNGVRFDVLEIDGNRIEKIGVNFIERPPARRSHDDYFDDDDELE